MLLESNVLGGRAAEAPEIWNFPGFPEGISGVELVERMFKQAERFGAELVFPEEVVDLNLKGKVKTVTTRCGQRSGLIIIIATGTHRKKLAVPGETELLGRGVSYCAVCDDPLFKGRTTAVVGFGNEAFEDALYLSELSEKVILVAHSSEIEAEKALVDQCAEKDNIEMLKARAKAILGDEFVTSIAVSDLENGEEKRIPVEGIFLSLGGVPMTNLVKKTGIEVDKRGCIKVDRRQATNVEGVYAAGDCTCGGMQIVTAAGEGAMAAIQAYRYVKRIKKRTAPKNS